MNLLFVEDNEASQELLGILFESWGIDFDIASNGKEAVELAQSNEGKYDLCFMDTDMPEMDGFEATRIIRQNVRYFPILSTSVDFTYENKLLGIGVDEFIAKPFDPNELHRKIKTWNEAKICRIAINEDKYEIKKEMPMGSKQAAVLKELKEKGLSVINIFGTATEATFIVNDLVPEHIEKEFAEEQKLSVKFLDHKPESKGLCRLFAKTSMVVKTLMLDEDFEEENQLEVSKLKKISIMTD